MRTRPGLSLVLSATLALTSVGAFALPTAVAADPRHAAHPTAPAASEPRVAPIPDVEGPLAATPRSHPFGAAASQEVPQKLARDRYVE